MVVITLTRVPDPDTWDSAGPQWALCIRCRRSKRFAPLLGLAEQRGDVAFRDTCRCGRPAEGVWRLRSGAFPRLGFGAGGGLIVRSGDVGEERRRFRQRVRADVGDDGPLQVFSEGSAGQERMEAQGSPDVLSESYGGGK